MFTLGVYNVGDKKYWDYASARGLAAATTVVAANDIERMARPGRYAAANTVKQWVVPVERSASQSCLCT